MTEPKFDYPDRLASDTRLVVQMISDVDHAVEAECWETVEQGLICWALIEQAQRDIARIRDDLAAKLADEMPEKSMVVEGAGVFEKHRKSNRTKWDKDDLLRAVLDTRRVDDTTGEIEPPIDKVLHVWNLGAPRVTALRERGLDPDEFCSVEYGALTLQLTGEVKEEAA